MPRLARCPHCDRSLQVPDALLGQQVCCSHCAKAFLAESAPSCCPVCKAALPPGAAACPDCGYQPTASPADESAANLCPNPVCGVANAPNVRLCQRCGTPLPATMGQVLLGKYRIDRQLATGGFGIVYLGTELASNRPVAIKEMIVADSQEFNLRKTFFQREAAILEHLQSAAIVPRLFEYIDGKDNAFLVMEYIPGRNLLEVLEEPGRKPFSVATVARWGVRIAEVLEHMHSRQPAVVHRDLKPENIMLLPDGESIRMIDFGTARTMGKAGKDRNVSRTKIFTEGYAPPEQVIGKAEPRSDLFALAGTLYHLATGQSPEGVFTGRDLTLKLQMPNSGIADAERWFYELLAINLAESTSDRYLCARDFRTDLERQALAREVVCPKCTRSNPVREPFCSACASPLTDVGEVCPKCHRENRLGCRFCIACGSRIH